MKALAEPPRPGQTGAPLIVSNRQGASHPEGKYSRGQAHSVIFDNTKIRQIAPGWHAVIPWSVGARQVIEWYDADASRRTTDPDMDAAITSMVNLARG